MSPSSGTARLCLAPLGPDDRAQVRRWLAMPEVHGWWGTQAAAAARLALALESPGAVSRLVVSDGIAVGYADAMESEPGVGSAPAPLDRRPASWECAVFIGSAAHRGQGLGALALAQLADEVFSSTLALAAFVRVPVRSERAARAIEAAGFRWLRVDRTDPSEPAWIMLRERPRA